MLLLSGFMSFIEQQTLQHICDGSEAAGLPEWDDFKADLQAGLIHFPSMRTPFLFAGECWSSLSNYTSIGMTLPHCKIDGTSYSGIAVALGVPPHPGLNTFLLLRALQVQFWIPLLLLFIISPRTERLWGWQYHLKQGQTNWSTVTRLMNSRQMT
jgi:hypothetical protein